MARRTGRMLALLGNSGRRTATGGLALAQPEMPIGSGNAPSPAVMFRLWTEAARFAPKDFETRRNRSCRGSFLGGGHQGYALLHGRANSAYNPPTGRKMAPLRVLKGDSFKFWRAETFGGTAIRRWRKARESTTQDAVSPHAFARPSRPVLPSVCRTAGFSSLAAPRRRRARCWRRVFRGFRAKGESEPLNAVNGRIDWP